MIRAALFFILSACLLGFPGCAAKGKSVLIFSETYWNAVIDQNPSFRSTLEREAARRGLDVTFVDVPRGNNYFEFLRQNLRSRPYDLVITGPLLCAEAVKMAPLYPLKRFAVLDMPRIDTAVPSNVVPVYSRRAPSFYEAGKLTGAVLSSGALPEAGKKVVVIASGMTRMEKEMLQEFERGFSVKGDTSWIDVKELGTAVDRVKAVQTVVDSLNENARLFFVKAYGLNGPCLEQIIGGGAYYIVEDADTFDSSKDKLFLSIEDDYTAPLAEILQSPDFTYHIPPVLPSKVVRGEAIKDFQQN
ncbi:MAG: hypothetical protein JXD23_15420 [Spirochaetales bacterium]|nr:hypothetical protein [Spirochaetales bacterium]